MMTCDPHDTTPSSPASCFVVCCLSLFAKHMDWGFIAKLDIDKINIGLKIH